MSLSVTRIGVSTVSDLPVSAGREKVLATTREFREIHSIYQTLLERELKHSFPLPLLVEELLDPAKGANESQPAPRTAEEWLELLDLAVTPHMIRSYINERGAEDSSLRVVIRFLVSKKSHTQDDRDKVDWLATRLFKLREEQKGRATPWAQNDGAGVLGGLCFPMLKM